MLFDAKVQATEVSSGLTVAHTCTGDDRLIVVAVLVRGAQTVDGVTYDGDALTLAVDHEYPGGDMAGRSSIWYLANPATGANDVEISLSGSVQHRVIVSSWTNADQAAPLDGTATGAADSNTASATVTTTVDDTMVVDAMMSEIDGATPSVGSGQTSLFANNNGSWADAGSHEAKATAGNVTMSWGFPFGWYWVSTAAAFKTATAEEEDTEPPSDPAGLTATPTSAVRINLNWTDSTDNVAVTGYRLERCTGAACVDFAELAAPAVSSYSDLGLTAETAYRYRVRAGDEAGNLSGYSAIVEATTLAETVAGSSLGDLMDEMANVLRDTISDPEVQVTGRLNPNPTPPSH